MHISAVLLRPTRIAIASAVVLVATAVVALPAAAADKVFDANDPHHTTATDGEGKVHIASENGSAGVWYITNKSGSWTSCQVSDGADKRPAIVVSGAEVHIAFARFTDGQKGIYTASTNVPAAAASCGFGITKRWNGNGFQPAMAASGDTLSIAFRAADKKLRFIKGSATDPSWTIKQTIDGKCCTSAPSIGLTASGSPRVLYGDGTSKADGLKFAVRTSKGWKKQKVHGGRIKHVDMQISWGVDPFTHTLKHGTHIAYVNGAGTYYGVKGNVGTGGSWVKRYLYKKTMPPQVQSWSNITKVIHGKGGNIWLARQSGGIWFTSKVTKNGTDGKPQLANGHLTFSRSGGIFHQGI